MSENFYVTTPIYYANARPHLGHVYTTLVADSLTRFKRQRGIESFFLTGTDEHGVNIERAAAARRLPVKEHVDQVVAEFKAAFAKFGIEYDRWIRTTDSYHEEAVQNLWRILEERGHIYKGAYSGWFCGYCNEFKDVDEKEEHPLCPDHDKPLDRLSEESYFFRLSQFQQPLLELYRARPDFVRPEARLNEVVSFVSGGLNDLSISRASVKWGVPVPGDPNHTVYVWLDALSNYITALGWGNRQYDDFDRFWPGLHLVGKDILRFHTVYWPAFLMGAGIEVPRSVFVHGMWLSRGRRMSKTLGNAIDLEVLHRHFTPEMVRYFVLREMVFGQDGDFTYEALIDRVNSDLADGLGNLTSRTLTMVRNYFGGQPPRSFEADDAAAAVEKSIKESKAKFETAFGDLAFSRAIEAAWAGIAAVDKYITDSQPWKLAKDESARQQLEAVISTAYEALRHVVLLVAPVLPQAARDIWQQMGLSGQLLSINPGSAQWGEPLGEVKIGDVRAAFPKLDKARIMDQIEGEKPKSKDEPKPADAGFISIDDFAKVELRAATVLEAERVPKADKLLRLIVDLGEEQPRQILAGIAQHYTPEDVVGRQIIVVSNLAPRKMRGLESNGMLLAASVGEEGRPILATFFADVPNGTRLK